MVNITHVDLLRLASSLSYGSAINSIANASTDHISFVSYNATFAHDILGPHASQELVAQLPWAAFHEAGVYNIRTGKLYATSNWNGRLADPINVTAIDIHHDHAISSVRYAHLAEANGGAAYYPVGASANSSAGQRIVYCDEGDPVSPGQLVLVDPATNASRVLVNSFLGRNFSSPNDVRQHEHTGDLWFTDTEYGYWQDFRPPPVSRPQVYRFAPRSGVIQAVADGFVAPNGIEFSPDFKHVYVTDTGSHTRAGQDDLTAPASIYRFDVTPDGARLENRQLFAYVDVGFPDGIHCDVQGNVWAACGDGVQVWNPQGVLLGKLVVGNGGSNNFAFVPGGLYVFNAERLFKVNLLAEGRSVKRDFGLFK